MSEEFPDTPTEVHRIKMSKQVQYVRENGVIDASDGFGALVTASIQAQDPKQLIELLVEVRGKNICLEWGLLASAERMLRDHDMLEEAMGVEALMSDMKVRPPEYYEALKMLERKQYKGVLDIYNALSGRDEMAAKELFQCAIDACIQLRVTIPCMELFPALWASGKPIGNRARATWLLRSCMWAADAEAAFSVLQQMIREALPIGQIELQLTARTAARSGLAPQAFAILRSLELSETPWEAIDHISFFIPGDPEEQLGFYDGDEEGARRVYEQWPKQSTQLCGAGIAKLSLYGSLTQEFARRGMLDDWVQFLFGQKPSEDDCFDENGDVIPARAAMISLFDSRPDYTAAVPATILSALVGTYDGISTRKQESETLDKNPDQRRIVAHLLAYLAGIGVGDTKLHKAAWNGIKVGTALFTQDQPPDQAEMAPVLTALWESFGSGNKAASLAVTRSPDEPPKTGPRARKGAKSVSVDCPVALSTDMWYLLDIATSYQYQNKTVEAMRTLSLAAHPCILGKDPSVMARRSDLASAALNGFVLDTMRSGSWVPPEERRALEPTIVAAFETYDALVSDPNAAFESGGAVPVRPGRDKRDNDTKIDSVSALEAVATWTRARQKQFYPVIKVLISDQIRQSKSSYAALYKSTAGRENSGMSVDSARGLTDLLARSCADAPLIESARDLLWAILEKRRSDVIGPDALLALVRSAKPRTVLTALCDVIPMDLAAADRQPISAAPLLYLCVLDSLSQWSQHLDTLHKSKGAQRPGWGGRRKVSPHTLLVDIRTKSWMTHASPGDMTQMEDANFDSQDSVQVVATYRMPLPDEALREQRALIKAEVESVFESMKARQVEPELTHVLAAARALAYADFADESLELFNKARGELQALGPRPLRRLVRRQRNAMNNLYWLAIECVHAQRGDTAEILKLCDEMEVEPVLADYARTTRQKWTSKAAVNAE